jgi:hypothetical protein
MIDDSADALELLVEAGLVDADARPLPSMDAHAVIEALDQNRGRWLTAFQLEALSGVRKELLGPLSARLRNVIERSDDGRFRLPGSGRRR